MDTSIETSMDTSIETSMETNNNILTETPIIYSNYKYIIYTLIILSAIISIYFICKKIADNSKEESFVNNQQQERSDCSSDFDLQSVINELNVLQNRVMSNITEDIDM